MSVERTADRLRRVAVQHLEHAETIRGTDLAAYVRPSYFTAVGNWLNRVADDEPSWAYSHAETEMLSAVEVCDAWEDGK